MKYNEPHNIEAEQGVLGAIMLNNDVFAEASGMEPDHFYDPVHQKIFEVSREWINEGRLVSPVTLKDVFYNDDGLAQLGGASYLAKLAGAASLSAVSEYRKVILALWARRRVVAVGSDIAQQAQDPGAASTEQLMIWAEQEMADIRQRGDKPLYQSWLGALVEAANIANEAYQEERPPGVKTGVRQIDDIIGTLRPATLNVLAGRSSMGKTMVGMNIAQRVAKGGGNVIIASLEMKANEIVSRGISQQLRERGIEIKYSDILDGRLTEKQFRQVLGTTKQIERLPIRFIGKDNSQRQRLLSSIKAVSRSVPKVDLVVVDYLQRVRPNDERESDYKNVSAATAALKDLAMELDCPVLALSQVSRRVEERANKRPSLADLKESGRIEEDADTVMFTFREEYYLERERPRKGNIDEESAWYEIYDKCKGTMEIIVAKQRNGRIATATVKCDVTTNWLDVSTQEDFDF